MKYEPRNQLVVKNSEVTTALIPMSELERNLSLWTVSFYNACINIFIFLSYSVNYLSYKKFDIAEFVCEYNINDLLYHIVTTTLYVYKSYNFY